MKKNPSFKVRFIINIRNCTKDSQPPFKLYCFPINSYPWLCLHVLWQAAKVLQTFPVGNPLSIISQNRDRIRKHLELLVSARGSTIGKFPYNGIFTILMILPLLIYYLLYLINVLGALFLWQTLFYTLEIQWPTRHHVLLLWKGSRLQGKFWWSK